MRTVFSLSTAFAVSATCLAGFASLASASPIVLFQDDFENVAAGEAPVASIGTYYTGSSPAFNGRVVTAGVSPAPAAPSAGGTQLLSTNAPASIGTRNFGSLESVVDTPGATVTFQVDLLLQSGSTFQFGMVSEDRGNSANKQSLLFMLRDTGRVDIYRYGAYRATGFTHTVGQWQTYAVSYTIGATDAVLRVGTEEITIDNPFSDPATTTPLPPLTQINRVFVTSGSANTVGYSDNWLATAIVPEPASAMMVLIAFAPLAARRNADRD